MVDIVKPTNLPILAGSSELASSVGFGVSPLGPASPRQQFQILRDLASIRDNVRNILYFRKGDYYDDPDFGVGLQDYLFEQNDEIFRLALSQEIRRQITTYEPRVSITTLVIYEPDWVDHAAVIDLVCEIGGANFAIVADNQGNFTLNQKENG